MSELYEKITQTEMLGLAFMIMSALVLTVSIIFFCAILISNSGRYSPVLRPTRDSEMLKKYILDMKTHFPAYIKNIMTLDEGKALKNENRDIGLLILKNYGNCSAIDIQIKKVGDYTVEENFENKYMSIAPGECVPFVIEIPKELLSSIKVTPVTLRYKNFLHSGRSDKFAVICDADISYALSEKYTIYPLVQI